MIWWWSVVHQKGWKCWLGWKCVSDFLSHEMVSHLWLVKRPIVFPKYEIEEILKSWTDPNNSPEFIPGYPGVAKLGAPEHPPQAVGLAAPTWQPLQDHCATLVVLCLVHSSGAFELFHRSVMLCKKEFLAQNTSHSMVIICLHVCAFHVEAVPKLVSHSLTQMGSISGASQVQLWNWWKLHLFPRTSETLPLQPTAKWFLPGAGPGPTIRAGSVSLLSYVLSYFFASWLFFPTILCPNSLDVTRSSECLWRMSMLHVDTRFLCAACTHDPDVFSSHSCGRKRQSTCTRAGETCNFAPIKQRPLTATQGLQSLGPTSRHSCLQPSSYICWVLIWIVLCCPSVTSTWLCPLPLFQAEHLHACVWIAPRASSAPSQQASIERAGRVTSKNQDLVKKLPSSGTSIANCSLLLTHLKKTWKNNSQFPAKSKLPLFHHTIAEVETAGCMVTIQRLPRFAVETWALERGWRRMAMTWQLLWFQTPNMIQHDSTWFNMTQDCPKLWKSGNNSHQIGSGV